MKKLYIFIVLALLTFNIAKDVSATGYAGSQTFNLPGVAVSGTGYYAYRNNSDYPTIDPFTFSSLIRTDFRMQSVVFGANFKKSMFGSGQTRITLSNIGNGVAPYSNCPGYAWGLSLDVRDTGSGYTFSLSPYTQSFCNYGTDNTVYGATVDMYTLPYDYSCGPNTTDTNECIVMVKPVIYADNTTTLKGTYLAYSDIAIYNASGSQALWNRYYWDRDQSAGSSSWFESALQWFNDYDGSYGVLLINQYLPFWDGQYAFDFFLPRHYPIASANRFHYYSLTGTPKNDDTLMRDFMVGATGSSLSVTTKSWFGYSTLNAYSSGTGGSGNPTNWGSGTLGGMTTNTTGSNVPGWADTDKYFAGCSSWTDIGCYIRGFTASFFDSIKDWFSTVLGYFFPDVSFNGMSDTCLGSSSGSTSTGSMLSSSGVTTGFVQKVANIFVVLLPTAPPDGSTVCTLDGQKIIHYDNRLNYFDIMLILAVFFPILLSLKAHKND